MHLFFKKLKFLPALLVLRMSMPFMAAAQTTTMTNGSLRPLPVVSDEVKALRTTQIALADETPEIQTPVKEVEETNEQLKLYNMNVDTAEVQEAWLGWINYERGTRGLDPLELDLTLNNTSTEWATYLANARKFTKMHQRPGQACKNARCYDLDGWFSARGVNPAAGESVMFGGYSCKAEDCTTDLIETTRGKVGGASGFLGFLLGEKRYNGVHYRMMMNPSTTKVGIGMAKTTHSGFGGAYIGVLHFSK